MKSHVHKFVHTIAWGGVAAAAAEQAHAVINEAAANPAGLAHDGFWWHALAVVALAITRAVGAALEKTA